MKKIIAVLLLAVSVPALAQYRHHHHHGHGGYGWGWVAPLVIGGAVGYAISRPAPPTPATVVYVPQGYPPPPVGYKYEQILDAACNCYRWVLVQS